MRDSRIGIDEWVSQHAERVSRPKDLRNFVYDYGERIPLWARFLMLLAIGLLIPIFTDNQYYLRVAGTVALMTTLGIGLNIVVGYAGMLDLGFVAFYGIGGYTYAYLSSDFTGVHLPAYVTLPLATIIAALFGLLLGSPSLRLVGDYLAIVTLAFGQIFVQLATSLTRVSIPGREESVNLTGGPNGIVNLDDLSLFGLSAKSVEDYYYILLIVMVIVLLLVYFLNNSRLGRAWRSLKEDELAAEAMGMPTRRLKLQAFAIGAAIAGLSGALFAAQQGSVFPANFDVIPLITVYAIVVLGGLGSLPGVLLGSIFMVLVPEILRDVESASFFFYVGIVIIMAAILKPRWQVPLLLILVVIFGVIIRLAAVEIWSDSIQDFPDPANVYESIRGWLAFPAESTTPGNLAFGAMVLLVLLVARVKHLWIRFALLIPTLYLLVFVWETRLVSEPSVTRLIFVGLLLVVLMIYRPHGLLGQARVEVV